MRMQSIIEHKSFSELDDGNSSYSSVGSTSTMAHSEDHNSSRGSSSLNKHDISPSSLVCSCSSEIHTSLDKTLDYMMNSAMVTDRVSDSEVLHEVNNSPGLGDLTANSRMERSMVNVAFWLIRQQGDKDEGPFPEGNLIRTHFGKVYGETIVIALEGTVLLSPPGRNDHSSSRLLPKIVGNIRLSPMKFTTHAEMTIMVTACPSVKNLTKSRTNRAHATEKVARSALALVKKMFNHFEDGARIAKLQRDYIVNIGLKEDIRDLPLQPREEDLIQTCLGYRFLDWKRVSINTPNMFRSTTVEGKELTHWGKFVTRVDTSAESLLAWHLNMLSLNTFPSSRNSSSKSRSSQRSRSFLEYVNGSRSQYRSLSIKLLKPFNPRQLNWWTTWDLRVVDGKPTYVLCFTELTEHARSGAEKFHVGSHRKKKIVKAKTRGIYLFEWVTKESCEWTVIQFIDLDLPRGTLSKIALDMQIKAYYNWTKDLSYFYKRNEDEVDAEVRAEMVSKIKFVEANLDQHEEPIASQLSDDQYAIYNRCKIMTEGMTQAERIEQNLVLQERTEHKNTFEPITTEIDKKNQDETSNINSRTLVGLEETASLDGSFESSSAQNSETSSWTPIISSSPFVKMFVKNVYSNISKEESTSVVCCRSETVVDCSAEEALAWNWDYISYDRLAKSAEEKNLGRLVVSKHSTNDWVIATIKRSPPGFRPREFVARQIWCIEKKGVFLHLAESVEQVVDWGTPCKVVRGFSRYLMRCESLPPLTPQEKRCKVSIYSIVDAGAPVPRWIKNNYMVVHGLSVLISMRKKIYDLVKHDALIWEQCRQRMVNHITEEYSSEELELVDEIVKHGQRCLNDTNWKIINHPEKEVGITFVFNDDSNKQSISGTVVVMAPKEVCAAYDWCVMSNRRVQDDADLSPSAERHCITENNHTHVFQFTKDIGIKQLGIMRPREWVMRRIWKVDETNSDIIYCVSKTIEHPRFPYRQNFVRCDWVGLTTFKTVRDKDGRDTGKTLVTHVADGTMKLNVKYMSKRLTASFLDYMRKMRYHLNYAYEHDVAKVNSGSESIRKNVEEFGEVWMKEQEKNENTQTKQIIRDIHQYITASLSNVERYTGAFPLCEISYSLVDKEYNGTVYGSLKFKVRANLWAVLAYLWDEEIHQKANSGLWVKPERKTLHKDGPRRKVVYSRLQVPWGPGGGQTNFDRDFIQEMEWNIISEDNKVARITSCPTNHDSYPPMGQGGTISMGNSHSAVRSSKWSFITITTMDGDADDNHDQLADQQCLIEYVTKLELCNMNDKYLNKFVLADLLEVADCQHFFQWGRSLANYDSLDGIIIGNCITWTPPIATTTTLMEKFEKHRGLKELNFKFPWFFEFLRCTLTSRRENRKGVNLKLILIEPIFVQQMASNLWYYSKRMSANEAVKHWLNANTSMNTLVTEHRFLKGMLMVLANKIKEDSKASFSNKFGCIFKLFSYPNEKKNIEDEEVKGYRAKIYLQN